MPLDSRFFTLEFPIPPLLIPASQFKMKPKDGPYARAILQIPVHFFDIMEMDGLYKGSSESPAVEEIESQHVMRDRRWIMAKQARFPGSEKSHHLSPKNLYRERWALSLVPPMEPVPGKNGLNLRGDLVAVRHRFSGGMVYEAGGKKFLLVEQVFAGYPFLLNFSLQPREEKDFLTPKFMGLPEEVMTRVRKECEQVAATVKLPENLHNVEVEVTGHLSKKLNLPHGWGLAKAIMKVAMTGRIPGLTCDCDVDGPCGYCCDVCDCNSCYLCC